MEPGVRKQCGRLQAVDLGNILDAARARDQHPLDRLGPS
jgi:hypothetical protein